MTDAVGADPALVVSFNSERTKRQVPHRPQRVQRFSRTTLACTPCSLNEIVKQLAWNPQMKGLVLKVKLIYAPELTAAL